MSYYGKLNIKLFALFVKSTIQNESFIYNANAVVLNDEKKTKN